MKVAKFTQKDRIAAFRTEWQMREAFMKAAGISEEEMDDHRREILHRYQLTEREVEGTDEE